MDNIFISERYEWPPSPVCVCVCSNSWTDSAHKFSFVLSERRLDFTSENVNDVEINVIQTIETETNNELHLRFLNRFRYPKLKKNIVWANNKNGKNIGHNSIENKA